MKTQSNHHDRAFTLFEGLLVGSMLLLLLAIVSPLLARPRHQRRWDYCTSNLKQVGIAFRIWEGDNNDKYPMAVAVTNGGVMELIATGDVTTCFQVMSNELATPKILICPADTHHQFAANFASLTPSNLSYFIALDASESDPQSILSGDASLLQNGRPVPSGILNLGTPNLSWSKDRHNRTGNILLADGSVQAMTSHSLTNYLTTNRVVIP